MTPAYDRTKPYSTKIVEQIRADFRVMAPEGCVVATYGSFARCEASEQSDMDYIVLSKDVKIDKSIEDKVIECIKRHAPNTPAADGAFGGVVPLGDLCRNLGGDGDANHNITRRLLLLLEGTHLHDETAFLSLRETLIHKYVEATPKDHQLALFLLNDIIRYWRTMTVDYMYKTTETKKPWAIRNIKLVFSRKLLYASGLFSVGVTVDKRQSAKEETLRQLFSLSPLERLSEICGKHNCSAALSSYNFFLEQMDQERIRNHLKSIEKGNHDDEIFRALKNEGHIFTRSLLKLFEATFHSTHPIHRAVVF